MKRKDIDRMLLADPVIARELQARKIEYLNVLAESVESDERFVDVLQAAGFPVANRARETYWSWEDRHLYSSELQSLARQSARRVANRGALPRRR